MQQGPSALVESQAELRVWARRLADEARAAGARPGLLTSGPSRIAAWCSRDVMASYLGAAQAAGADLYPAGAPWFAAWQSVPKLGLYGPDGFHPSRVGTYAAALVVYGRLFKAPLLTAALRPSWLSPRVARLARASAARALGRRVPVARRCGA